MNLLLVEDEKHLSIMVYDFLTAKGCHVTCASDGFAGLDIAKKNSFDVLILDVMLPGIDGFTILEKLRADSITTPALFLTARSELSDKLAGFKAGAQDYLTKPFELEELYARIQVLASGIYGTKPSGSSLPSFHELRLDPAHLLLQNNNNGKSVRLSAKEYDLINYFIENDSQLLSKEQITVYIWGYDTEAEYNNTEVYISFLRKKMRFLQTNVQIRTVRGKGYILEEAKP